jgi:dihydrofolate reductase
MRKLILQMQMSIDGCVGSDEGHDWQLWGWGDSNPWDEDLKRDFNATMQSVDTILLSRKMAEEGYLSHWSNAASKYPQDPFYAFAQRIVDVDKVVASSRLAESRWPRTIVRSGDLPNEVAALKVEGGGDIITFGGAGFASALIAADLVDEFQFYINPAALGDGIRIFDRAGFRKLTLLTAKTYACGMLLSRYGRKN